MPAIQVTPPPAEADFRPGTMPGLAARRVGRGETLSAVLVTLMGLWLCREALNPH